MVVCDELFLRLPLAQLAKYIAEISRVLRQNGRCVVTAFLLTSETNVIASSLNGIILFPFEHDGYRVSSLDDPAPAVAIKEDLIRDILGQYGLRICEIVYGFWANRPDLLQALHDCVVAIKQGSVPIG